MRNYDVADEAIFRAPRAQTFRLLAEILGGDRNDDLADAIEIIPHADSESIRVGARLDVLEFLFGSPHYTMEVTGIHEGYLVSLRILRGDFIGSVLWTVEDHEHGARVRYRWIARPSSTTMKLFGRKESVERAHTDVMRRVFRAMRSELEKRNEPPVVVGTLLEAQA